jgi:hypothetical protein
LANVLADRHGWCSFSISLATFSALGSPYL